MRSKKVEEALNRQVMLEGTASHTYLAMACWCETHALTGCAKFFFNHAEEERMHMLKLVHYINESGGTVTVPAIDQPDVSFANIQDLFEKAYVNELFVSQSIDELVETCTDEKDKQTSIFLQWYVSEQHEEEATYRNLLDKIRLIGVEGRGLYFIDKEVEVYLADLLKKEASAR